MNNPTDESVYSLKEERFKYLLVLLLVIFFIVPAIATGVMDYFSYFSRLVYLLLFASVLFLTASLIRKRRVLWWVLVSAILAVFLNVIYVFTSEVYTLIFHHLIITVLLVYAIVSLMYYLFTTNTVSRNTIYAALCAYLLVALAFAMLFSVVSILIPESFIVDADLAKEGDSLISSGANTYGWLYYSFVTITTLGYGDISPVSGPARALSTAEAFIGEMYAAIMIAKLVGIYVTRSK